ncbi:MAG: NAD-dependent epimerase/dehydratase family protein [Isosphaeraceae bacterium]
MPAVRKALSGARHVYHLAANPQLWARDRHEFDAVNHRGTIHVLDAARDAGPGGSCMRAPRASSPAPMPMARSMRTWRSSNRTPSAYCLSKLRAEKGGDGSRSREGHPILIANPTMPVGPGDRGLSPPTRLILDFCRGNLPARMDCTLNLVDVRDAADGLVRILERGQPGRRYLLAGTNLTLLDLFKRLSSLTGRPIPRFRVPYPLGLAVAAVSEIWADRVTGRLPRATITGVRLARRIMHFDPSKTRAELGLETRPVDESLVAAVAWLREQGMLADASRPGPGPGEGVDEPLESRNSPLDNPGVIS